MSTGDAPENATASTAAPARDLVLIVPDGFTGAGTVQAFGEVIRKYRWLLLDKAELFDVTAKAVRGDSTRQAFLNGQAVAYQAAVEALDEAFTSELNLRTQDEEWRLTDPEAPQAERQEHP